MIFSYFTHTIEQIQKLLGKQCLPPITGKTSATRRQQIVDEFIDDTTNKVLVGQIQAAGTGLNIQAASIVVICEPQIKPSIENQAISRAYRKGQSQSVNVYRLLCTNSIDQRMLELLNRKQSIFNNYADESLSGESSIALSDHEITQIMEEELERIKNKNKIA